MALFMNKTLVALKKETTFGTAATLAGTDCFLVSNVSLTPLAGNTATRDFVRPYFGQSSSIQLDSHVELSFDVELASSGAAGSRPAYGDALLACGFEETLTASTDAVYELLSGDFDSVTIEVFMDGIKHQITGARGSFSLSIARGAIPSISFNFMGNYVTPADATPLVPNFSDFKIPLGANSANTATISLFEEDLCVESFSADLANNLVYRDLPGCDPAALITDRAPTGTLVFEATTITTYNWINAAKVKTAGAFQLIHGTAAGSIVQIDAPNVTINPPSYQDSDGVMMLSAPMVFEPTSAGNDELVLTFK